MDEIALKVGGKSFSGWESVRVSRSLESICGSFKLAVSQAGGEPFPIPENSPIEIEIGGELYLSGFVDKLEVTFGRREHSISVEGRDKAQDLVDCSSAEIASEFADVNLLELAKELCAPWGVEALLSPGLDVGEPFERFCLQKGESAFESLERACRMRSMLAISDARGRVLLTRAGLEEASGAIVQGENLAAAKLRIDSQNRFARYVVLGQLPGLDESFGEDSAEIMGEAFDEGAVRSRRTLVLQAEANLDNEGAQALATWHANVRAARATSLQASLKGWRQNFSSGPLWVPNLLVDVSIPLLKVRGSWLVASVELARTKSEGTTTELSLARRDAFLPEPPKPENELEFGEDLEGNEEQ